MKPAGNLMFLSFLYFLQGLPYGLQSKFLPIYFYTRGMTLSHVSMLKLLLTPWMGKALWAPLVDGYGSKKTWLTNSMLGLSAVCMLGSMTSPEHIVHLACVLFLFNLLTATQDIAVDGLAIQMLATSELANGNIAQVVSYKFGAIVSGGILTWLSEYVHWSELFIGLTLIYFFAFLFVKNYVLERSDGVIVGGPVQHSEHPQTYPGVWEHFRKIFANSDTRWLIAFVLLYKLGENGTLSMLPLFLVDQKIPTSSVGFWTGIVGQFTAIAGALLGGWLVSAHGFTPFEMVKSSCRFRIFFIVIQILVVFTWLPGVASTVHYVISLTVMMLMQTGSGIITTATFTLMMYSSQRAPPALQASHYTTLATLEVLGKLTFSVMTGPLTDMIGFPAIFCLFIVLSIGLLPILDRCPRVLVEMSEEYEIKED